MEETMGNMNNIKARQIEDLFHGLDKVAAYGHLPKAFGRGEDMTSRHSTWSALPPTLWLYALSAGEALPKFC